VLGVGPMSGVAVWQIAANAAGPAQAFRVAAAASAVALAAHAGLQPLLRG